MSTTVEEMETHVPSQPPPFMGLGERMAEAIRTNNFDPGGCQSPFTAALLPLLEALGRDHCARDLVESLPHFVDDIDLIDLRNILVRLGYQSRPVKTKLRHLSADLYPALFICKSGDVLILEEHRGNEILFLNVSTGERETTRACPGKGTAYLFNYTGKTAGLSALDKGVTDWFHDIVMRFRGWLMHLLLMTFMMNLVAVAVPLFTMVVYDQVIGKHATQMLPYLLLGVGMALSIDFAMRLIRARIIGHIAGRLDYVIGSETFDQLLMLPPSFTERSTVASQLARLKQFDAVRDFFTGPNASLLLELPFVLILIGIIALISGAIALVPLVVVIVYIVFGMIWLPILAPKTRRSGIARTERQKLMMQTFLGRREIKAAGAESMWFTRLREVSAEAVAANYKSSVGNAVLHSVAQTVVNLSVIAVLGLGTVAVMAGDMSIGALIATMALVWRVLSPLQNTFLAMTRIQHIKRTILQINQLMRLDSEQDAGHSHLLMEKFEGKIDLDRVSFRYGPNTDPALLGATLTAEPGQMVAIIGSTGSGKSTLIKMIAGMYRPQAGALSIDGLDLRQIDAIDLRRAIAYVPQHPELFHGTITQNLRLNNMLATDEDLHQAAEEAGILEDILKLPKGFETRIGDKHTDALPPGFAHSLCMTRAFIRDTRILLLDEPGASLDFESDQRIMDRIHKLKGKKTIIMVTHRPSHIRMAHHAVLLDRGTTVFSGDPEAAIAKLMETAQ